MPALLHLIHLNMISTDNTFEYDFNRFFQLCFGCKKTAVTTYIIIVTAVFYSKSIFEVGTLHRTCGMFAE